MKRFALVLLACVAIVLGAASPALATTDPSGYVYPGLTFQVCTSHGTNFCTYQWFGNQVVTCTGEDLTWNDGNGGYDSANFQQCVAHLNRGGTWELVSIIYPYHGALAGDFPQVLQIGALASACTPLSVCKSHGAPGLWTNGWNYEHQCNWDSYGTMDIVSGGYYCESPYVYTGYSGMSIQNQVTWWNVIGNGSTGNKSAWTDYSTRVPM